MTKTMRRWSMSAIGRDKLKLETVAIPEPGPGEVRVKVSAASLNYRDKLVIETGMGLTLPRAVRSGLRHGRRCRCDRFQRQPLQARRPGDVDHSSRTGSMAGDNGNARTPAYQTTGGFYQGMLADYVVFPQDWFVASPQSLDDARGKHPARRRPHRMVRTDGTRQAQGRLVGAGPGNRRRCAVRAADSQGLRRRCDRDLPQRRQAGTGEGTRRRSWHQQPKRGLGRGRLQAHRR
jgi:hypothetical protein